MRRLEDAAIAWALANLALWAALALGAEQDQPAGERELVPRQCEERP